MQYVKVCKYVNKVFIMIYNPYKTNFPSLFSHVSKNLGMHETLRCTYEILGWMKYILRLHINYTYYSDVYNIIKPMK